MELDFTYKFQYGYLTGVYEETSSVVSVTHFDNFRPWWVKGHGVKFFPPFEYHAGYVDLHLKDIESTFRNGIDLY